jgi:hypothetical protein
MRELANTPTHDFDRAAAARPGSAADESATISSVDTRTGPLDQRACLQRLMQQHSQALSQTFSSRVRSIAHGAGHANDCEPGAADLGSRHCPRGSAKREQWRVGKKTSVTASPSTDFPHDCVSFRVRQLRDAGRRPPCVGGSRGDSAMPRTGARRTEHEAKAKRVPLRVGASHRASRVGASTTKDALSATQPHAVSDAACSLPTAAAPGPTNSRSSNRKAKHQRHNGMAKKRC